MTSYSTIVVLYWRSEPFFKRFAAPLLAGLQGRREGFRLVLQWVRYMDGSNVPPFLFRLTYEISNSFFTFEFFFVEEVVLQQLFQGTLVGWIDLIPSVPFSN